MNNFNPTLYEVLGRIPEDSTNDEIENAYKKLAMLYHPDLNPNRREWAEEQMKKLNEAKEILVDSEKKRKYQEELLSMRSQTQKKEKNHTKKKKKSKKTKKSQTEETYYTPQYNAAPLYQPQQSPSGAEMILVGVSLALFALGEIVTLFDDED